MMNNPKPWQLIDQVNETRHPCIVQIGKFQLANTIWEFLEMSGTNACMSLYDKEVVIKYFVQVIRIKILKVNDRRMLFKYVASRASTFMIIPLPTRIMLVITHIHGKGILTKRARYAKTPLRPRLSKPPPAPSPPHCAYHATWKPARKRISQHASLPPRLPFERRPRADWAGTVREH